MSAADNLMHLTLSFELAEQEGLRTLVEQSVGLDLAARKVPSPVSRYLRYNLCAAVHIVRAHERRHLWQARRAALAVREKAAFMEKAG